MIRSAQLVAKVVLEIFSVIFVLIQTSIIEKMNQKIIVLVKTISQVLMMKPFASLNVQILSI